jgi:geranylgeranyl reductase family protein
MGSHESYDIAVIGAGPAGAAAAIEAARSGASVIVFDKAPYGRDKVCGDGLTPRAVGALLDLGISLDDAHRIDGLRMIAGTKVRELPWPETSRFPAYGAVWPRRRLDASLMDAATDAGAIVRWDTEAIPVFADDGRVTGVTATPAGDSSAAATTVDADLVVVATGAPGQVARMVGAERDPAEPFGLAIRTYAESPRHADRHLEACLTLSDRHGTAVPGYGWMFPAGDGTVNIGVGALSTMKGFKQLNLNTLLDSYRGIVEDDWQLGPNLERPRAWRLPMSAQRRHGPGWVAVGDAAGLINPMNGEGIDYGLESGMLAAQLFVIDPATAPERYDQAVGERFDGFLRTGRRFSFLIGHPWILRAGLRLAVGTQSIANLTLQIMGNLVDSETPGTSGRVLTIADTSLAVADPLLRRTRAAS